MRPPSGYESSRLPGAIVVSCADHRPFVESAIQQGGTLYRFATGNARLTLQGRVPACVIAGPDGDWVVRHYVRGGAVARRLGDRYPRLGVPRPWRELWASAFARARGVTTPEVTAAVLYPATLFYRADLATRFVPDAQDLATLTFGAGRRPDPQRMLAWWAAGRLVHDAAAAGIVHADLNLRNILVGWRAGAPWPHLLDLDRCRVVRRASRADVSSMLRRLSRSAHKFEAETGQPLQGELKAFVQGLHV